MKTIEARKKDKLKKYKEHQKNCTIQGAIVDRQWLFVRLWCCPTMYFIEKQSTAEAIIIQIALVILLWKITVWVINNVLMKTRHLQRVCIH